MEVSLGSAFLSVVLGALGGVALKVFYRLVRDEWPQLYTYNKSLLERSIQQNGVRYLAFQALPTLGAFLAVSTTASRLNLISWLAVTTAVLVFASSTSWRILTQSFKYKRRRFVTVLTQVWSTMVILILGCVAILFGRYCQAFIPSPEAFVEAAWTAVFVAIGLHGAKTLFDSGVLNNHRDRIEAARKDVGERVWQYAAMRGQECGVPVRLLQAIIVAESMQRPRWIRRLERLTARVTFHKISFTQGVTQEQSTRVLSDVDSIEKTIRFLRNHLSDEDISRIRKWDYECREYDEIKRLCEQVVLKRLSDKSYVELVVDLAFYLGKYDEDHRA